MEPCKWQSFMNSSVGLLDGPPLPQCIALKFCDGPWHVQPNDFNDPPIFLFIYLFFSIATGRFTFLGFELNVQKTNWWIDMSGNIPV